MLKLIYIAGPYRSATVAGIRQNIENARQVAEYWVKKDGWYPVTPHLNTAFMDGLASDKIFLDGALKLLEMCDAVCLVDGWWNSDGALAEVEHAKQIGKPIFLKRGGHYEIGHPRPS